MLPPFPAQHRHQSLDVEDKVANTARFSFGIADEPDSKP